ncbi:MAG: EamA family transporter RarD [Anaerolineae bacterium]|nr:EamA family transporter RarD [Anaerolineae bacterium]
MLWGFLPVYLKQLGALSPLEILAHRVVWALTFCAALVTASARWGELWAAVRQRSTLVWFALSAATLAANWLIYIWAVNTARVVEGSLGYFITPLINAGLGVVVLHERLRLGQWVAFALGGVGVGYLGIVYGQFPVVGLALALTFGVYGLLRKRAVLDSLLGLTLETALAAPLALAFLLAQTLNGNGAFIREGWQITLLLLAAGPVTAMPLLLFAAGARHIPLRNIAVHYADPSVLTRGAGIRRTAHCAALRGLRVCVVSDDRVRPRGAMATTSRSTGGDDLGDRASKALSKVR